MRKRTKERKREQKIYDLIEKDIREYRDRQSEKESDRQRKRVRDRDMLEDRARDTETLHNTWQKSESDKVRKKNKKKEKENAWMNGERDKR